MTIYFAHGLAIRSDVPLPELVTAGSNGADVDVTIRLGQVARAATTDDGDEIGVREGPEGSRILTSDCGRFLIRGGHEIIVDPGPAATEEQLRPRILAPVMAILLHQRGLLVLHACTVAVDGEAVGIVGKSGQGKSTLMAALHKRGHDIVTDDMVGIETRSRPFTVYPSFPQIRLWPDTIVSVGGSPEDSPPASPGVEKRACRVRHGFADRPLDLKRIYVLAEGDCVEITPLRPAEACIELVSHLYAAAALGATDGVAGQFRRSAAVAKGVPVCRLARPLGLSALPALAAAVEENLARAEHGD